MHSWKVRLGLVLTMLAMLIAVSTPAVAEDFEVVCEVDDVEWVSGADGELDTDTDFDGWADSDLWALVTFDCDDEVVDDGEEDCDHDWDGDCDEEDEEEDCDHDWDGDCDEDDEDDDD